LDLITNIKNYLPWIAFASGLGGSLHCVGMCGGLVTASAQNTWDIFRYQLGRLLGYLVVGFFAGLLGKILGLEVGNPKLTLIPGLLMGILFIYWGVQNFRQKKSFNFLSNLNSKLYLKMLPKINFSKSFFTGLFSIFLPCGLLYGVVLGVAAFEHSLHAVFTMFFFWLGTLPAMMVAPCVIQKFLRPLKGKLPRAYALSLISVGLITISYRVIIFNKLNHHKLEDRKLPQQAVICH